jgi:hypothetical protein
MCTYPKYRVQIYKGTVAGTLDGIQQISGNR